ncbi:hypothetical protein TRV_02642 [Trichophyton verrucosum HKI 0517]|uniref:Uncharacterized protein n=1 Tax=Trichophyton verrucosum (strain HKI 0517) TaxID=663202 RepID=D4D6B7_TRIVH|nr:uncharacterized protein TRV_02642 [Trichophyton verrucosum HKI 0517]EFE42608.1 hypothetical protein TRV_02642 [Trichophyton verrucosum HKI 0517]
MLPLLRQSMFHARRPPYKLNLLFCIRNANIHILRNTSWTSRDRASAERPQSPRLYTPYTTQSPEISLDDDFISPEQREQIFNGVFPADFSGEVISLRTTRQEFHHISKAFRASTDKKSQNATVQFNEGFHSTTIRHNQVHLHSCLINSVSHQLWNLINLDEISFYCDSTISEGIPDPDIQMVIDSEWGMESVFAVEVGFSQTSVDLEKRMRHLIEKTTVKVAMLFDIKETPNYKNPLQTEENKKIYHSERMARPGNPSVLIQQYCKGRAPYSPVFLYGARWMGELTAAVQVFGKSTSTGEPITRTPRITFFGAPKSPKSNEGQLETPMYNAYPCLNVKLSDCVQSDDEAYNKELVLNWDKIRHELERARRCLAAERHAAAALKLSVGGNP